MARRRSGYALICILCLTSITTQNQSPGSIWVQLFNAIIPETVNSWIIHETILGVMDSSRSPYRVRDYMVAFTGVDTDDYGALSTMG